jgi:hypothetical protein
VTADRWIDNDDYKRGLQDRIRKLCVVNDTAERGVKLFQDFNLLLTKDEDEKQYLLYQLIEANRKSVPTKSTKDAVVESLLHD